ncbi:hypothetical protein [Streptomyces cavernae]|uniref:hypothetical protein n=1 Tax=Streptomyces cavernae TaxID=2259034 RepID=UPI000FEBFFD2|nr:hypothetical protein [Streptomyces cavernae]
MLLGSVLGLTVLAAAGMWMYFVYRLSDPATSLLYGIRIDGSRVSVKAPICPTDKLGTVEVYNSDSEKLVWRANRPKTPEGERGMVTLWKADDFLKASPETQPRTLPTYLDVSVIYAGGEGGGGDVFDVRKVKAARVPTGQYWTHDGFKTATQIDAQLKCRSAGKPSP